MINDQRITSILYKYMSPNNNPDITEIVPVKCTQQGNGKPPVNGRSPETEPKLNDENKGNVILFPRNDSDITEVESKEQNFIGAIIEEQKEKSDEIYRGTFPEEINNFVERAQYLPTQKSRSSDVSLLDFAGQSLFYTTHQAFMSWRTLYLLVTDMSLPWTDAVEEGACGIDGNGIYNIQEYVTYWLNSIHSHALIPEDDTMQREESGRGVLGTKRNHPFVILVGTHLDKIPKDLLDESKKTYFNDIRTVLKNSPLLFHLADEDFAISNLGSDPTINSLKSKIFEIAQKQKYWGEQIPARWIPLTRSLMELKNRGKKVMDYADVKSLNETLQVRIERPEEFDLFLRFEHDMGNIVFFK
ncbi:hypothetical protein CHS0354_035606 [Potamilus streckersoni]|uniref:Uncharacterized protein n=1 Tax=Potamilus streckersoni TaxID=2493646 RepID=A0AAE0RRY0_9BIVA|nr:hypothetical protein CHS0354_035606 [Potamilus streckersoni]